MAVLHTLEGLKKGDEFSGPLLVREAQMRTTRAGKPYLRLSLSDASGRRVSASIWDNAEAMAAELAPGTACDVLASGDEWNGEPQLSIRTISPSASVSAAELVPRAPEDPEAMYAEVCEAAAAISDGPIRKVVETMLGRKREALMTAPAAVSVHHDVVGGLLWHTLGMLRSARGILAVYPGLSADLLYAGVILHDLAKTEEMAPAADTGLAEDYTPAGRLEGHISMGAADVRDACREAGADREREMLLVHMLLSHHGTPEHGSAVTPLFPEAMALHLLDMLDSRMVAMIGARDRAEPGGFSEPCRAADGKKVYRPVLAPEGR